MLALFDVVAEMFFAPARGVEKAAKTGLQKTVCFYFVFLLLIFWPTASVIYPAFTSGTLVLLFIFKFCLSLLVIFTFSLFINGLADFFYNKSRKLKETLTSFIFVLTPFALLPVFLSFESLQDKVSTLLNWLSLWSFLLTLMAVKKLYGLGYLRSFLLLLLPFLFELLCFVLAFAYLATLISASFSETFELFL